MLDSALLDQNNATVTATGNGTIRNIGGVNDGAYVVAVTGTVSGTSPTLDVELKFSEDNDLTDIRETVKMPQITAKGLYWVRWASRRNYVRATFTVGGTTPSFGGTYAGIARGVPTQNRAG